MEIITNKGNKLDLSRASVKYLVDETELELNKDLKKYTCKVIYNTLIAGTFGSLLMVTANNGNTVSQELSDFVLNIFAHYEMLLGEKFGRVAAEIGAHFNKGIISLDISREISACISIFCGKAAISNAKNLRRNTKKYNEYRRETFQKECKFFERLFEKKNKVNKKTKVNQI